MPTPTPETHDRPPVAQRVVWRHPCDCPTASRPLELGEEAEHRFDVDGERFPWFIVENGASFLKHGESYLVRVAILPIEPGRAGYPLLDVTIPGEMRRQPRIGDKPFPWAILDGSISVEVTDGAVPILHLTFIANEVDADVEVPELDIWTARTPHEQDLERRAREAPFPTAGEVLGEVTDWEQRNAAALGVAEAINAPDLDLAIDAAEDRDA